MASMFALLQNNCAYFDTDIILLREPRKWLETAPSDVFVVADTEWAKNRWTFSRRFPALPCAALFLLAAIHVQFGFLCLRKALYEEDELIDSYSISGISRGTCLSGKSAPWISRQ